MWSDHAFSAEARQPASLALEVVYAAEADATFDAMKAPTEDRRLAIFRTVLGEGEIQSVAANGTDLPPVSARMGSVVLLEFHRVRRYRPRRGRWRFWFFEYEGDELPFQPGCAFPSGDLARDEAEAKECLESLRGESPGSTAYASALFTAMVHRWVVAFHTRTALRDPREPQVRAAIAEMRRSLHRPPSIPALAARAGMSERAFRSAFQAITDWSPKRYFDRLRLEKAAELLRQNRFSIGEIADMLCFSSPFHFSRAFRELFGVPPSTYASVLRSER